MPTVYYPPTQAQNCCQAPSADVASLHNRIAELEAELDAERAAKAQTERNLAAANRNLADARNANRSLQGQNEQLRRDLTACQTQPPVNPDELAACRNLNDTLIAEKASLSHDLAQAEQDLAECRQLNRIQRSQVESMMKCAEGQDTYIRALQAELGIVE